MEPLKPNIIISSTIKNVPLEDPTDGIFGKTGNNVTGQSNLIPNIQNSTSAANAVDALITYMEEGSTNNIIGVHTVTNAPITIPLVYDNGPRDNGIDATLTSTDPLLVINGLALQIGHRILITQAAVLADNVQNGVYNITSVSPFIAKRTKDNNFASYFNGTSFIVLSGGDVGKLYSVSFNLTVKDESYLIGYEPLIFDNISLGGSSTASTGISGVDYFVRSLPAYTSSGVTILTANNNGSIPLASPAVNKRVLYSGPNGTENGVYNILSVGSFLSPWILSRAVDFVAYNGTVLSVAEDNQTAFVRFNSSVGLNQYTLGVDLLFFDIVPVITTEVRNYKNSAGIDNTDSLNTALEKAIYTIDNLSAEITPLPSFDSVISSSIIDLQDFIPVILNSTSINDNIWQASYNPVSIGMTDLQLSKIKQRIIPPTGSNRFGPFRSQILNETSSHNFTITVNGTPTVTDLLTLPLNITTGFFKENGALHGTSKTRSVSVLYTNSFTPSVARPDGLTNNNTVTFNSSLSVKTYISDFYTYNSLSTTPQISLFDATVTPAISSQFISGVPRLRNNDIVDFDIELTDVIDRFIIPAPTNININNSLRLFSMYGYKVPASANYSDMDPDVTPLNDVLKNLDISESDLNGNLRTVRIDSGHIFEAYSDIGKIQINSDNLIGQSLPLSASPWQTQRSITINNSNAFKLPNGVNNRLTFQARAKRYDGVRTSINNFASKLLIDECSFKSSLVVSDYGAAFISEYDKFGDYVRVYNDGSTYNSENNIQLGHIYQDQLMLLGGKYIYPIGNFTANSPSNVFNFTVPAVRHMRYVVFRLNQSFTNVSYLNIEIINSDIALTGVDTRQDTGLQGLVPSDGIITNQDFTMEVTFTGSGVKGVGAPFTPDWIDANKIYDGSLLNCLDNGEPNKKRLTFGLVKYSGDLLIKIGISQFSGNVNISGVRVFF